MKFLYFSLLVALVASQEIASDSLFDVRQNPTPKCGLYSSTYGNDFAGAYGGWDGHYSILDSYDGTNNNYGEVKYYPWKLLGDLEGYPLQLWDVDSNSDTWWDGECIDWVWNNYDLYDISINEEDCTKCKPEWVYLYKRQTKYEGLILTDITYLDFAYKPSTSSWDDWCVNAQQLYDQDTDALHGATNPDETGDPDFALTLFSPPHFNSVSDSHTYNFKRGQYWSSTMYARLDHATGDILASFAAGLPQVSSDAIIPHIGHDPEDDSNWFPSFRWSYESGDNAWYYVHAVEEKDSDWQEIAEEWQSGTDYGNLYDIKFGCADTDECESMELPGSETWNPSARRRNAKSKKTTSKKSQRKTPHSNLESGNFGYGIQCNHASSFEFGSYQ